MDVPRKMCSLALAGVLVFFVACPVPSGIEDLDRARYGRAEAVVQVAAPLAAATVAALAGIYIGTCSGMDWTAACNTVFNGFVDYMESDYATQGARFLNAVNSDGQIDTSRLDQDLIADLTGYAASMYQSGHAVQGSSSNQAYEYGIYFGNYFFNGVSTPFTGFENLGLNWSDCIGVYRDLSSTNDKYFYLIGYESVAKTTSDPGVRVSSTNTYSVTINLSSGQITTKKESGRFHLKSWEASHYVNMAFAWPASVSGWSISAGNHPVADIVLSSAMAAGTAAIPQGVYDVFEPTAEQLESGYSTEDIVEALNAGNEIAGDISGSVVQVLSSVQQIVQVLGTVNAGVGSMAAVVTGIASAPFTWLSDYMDFVMDWMGVGSFGAGISGVVSSVQAAQNGIESGLIDVGGAVYDVRNTLSGELLAINANLRAMPTLLDLNNVMGTVISGVQAIPGAIGGAVDDLLGGVADLPGALEGLLEGVLDGVLSLPDAISLAASGVLDGVLDLAGTLEGFMNPFFQWPDMGVPSGSIALPPGAANGFQAALEDKVPFCYLIRSQNALSSMFSNFGGSRSFYFDLDVPKGDGSVSRVRFDGETVLSQPFGMLDIATTIKILATALLCLGLLYRSYKIIERMAL